MIYTEKQIKKIFKIKELRKIRQEILSFKNDNVLNSSAEYTNQEKQNLLSCIDEKIKTIQNYYKKTNKEQKIKLTRYTISYNQEQNQELETDLKRLQNYTKNDKLKMKDLIKIKSLSKDTLKPQELNTQQQHRDFDLQNQELTKEALQIFRNLGTNINQITKDLNERRLSDKFFNNNLTKEEKNNILTTIERLEIEVLKFIKSNL